MKKYFFFFLWVVFALVTLTSPVKAHILPGSYLILTAEGSTLRGTWDLSLYSLADMVGMQDEPERELQEFALGKLSVEANGEACKLQIDEVAQRKEEFKFPQSIHIAGACPRTITTLTVNYFSLLVIDPPFQGFVNITANGETYTSVLSQQNPYAMFQISEEEKTNPPDRLQQFEDYARAGVWHIWIGYDHILFLISLLLTAGFVRKAHHWELREGLKTTFWATAKIVTSFTLAHSVTLSLVIFGIVSLPSQLVESTIALSIAIAAANNLYPVMHKRLWLLTFCFGLIHGMGFAGALQELGLPDNAKWLALVGFNLGVEAGQLAIVAAVLPIIYFLRHNEFYRKIALPMASGLIIAVALIWFIQRAFGVSLFWGMLGG